jgi:hypothetical protein
VHGISRDVARRQDRVARAARAVNPDRRRAPGAPQDAAAAEPVRRSGALLQASERVDVQPFERADARRHAARAGIRVSSGVLAEAFERDRMAVGAGDRFEPGDGVGILSWRR